MAYTAWSTPGARLYASVVCPPRLRIFPIRMALFGPTLPWSTFRAFASAHTLTVTIAGWLWRSQSGVPLQNRWACPGFDGHFAGAARSAAIVAPGMFSTGDVHG